MTEAEERQYMQERYEDWAKAKVVIEGYLKEICPRDSPSIVAWNADVIQARLSRAGLLVKRASE